MTAQAPAAILRFDGDHRFLSNFYPWTGGGAEKVRDGITVVIYGCSFPSSEHAYQAAKCADAWDHARFRDPALTAGGAKRLGRQIALRSDWEAVKIQVMRAVVWDKFTRNPHMRDRLLATGSVLLEESNSWGDVFYGTCGGRGENWLGRILMDVRAVLAAQPAAGALDEEMPF